MTDEGALDNDETAVSDGWPVWLRALVESVHTVLDRADTRASLGAMLTEELVACPDIDLAWIATHRETTLRVRSAPASAPLPSTLSLEPGRQTLTETVESTGEVRVRTEGTPFDVRWALEHVGVSRSDTDGDLAEAVGSSVAIPLRCEESSYGVLHLTVAGEGPQFEAVLGSLGRTVARRLHCFETDAQLARERRRLESLRSMVSHDLGNPLNIASGRVELARLDEDVSHLDSVDGALDRADDIIERGVRLVEVGQPPTNVETLSIAALASDSWEDVGKERGGLTVEDARIRGERERVRMLLNELFRNALVHSDGDLSVEVGPLSESAGFYVEDDGPGIPADEREYVMEAGYTTTDRDGLGLALVSEIAGAHGWDVAVERGEAGGTRIELVVSQW